MVDFFETLKPQGQNGNSHSGIGYIAIPEQDGIDRDTFVDDCYRTNTVCIFGGVYHGLFYNVSIDKEVLKSITFPTEIGKYGSPVVWLNIEPHNKPVVVAVLKYESEYYLNKENQYNLTRSKNGNLVDVSIDGEEGSYEINIKTNPGVKGKYKLNIVNSDNTCEAEIYVKGKVKFHATEQIDIVSDKKIQLHVVDEKSVDRLILTYEKGIGLKYIDEFENEIECVEDFIKIKSKQINHSEGEEPMVLGNKLQKTLEDLISAISKLTVPTALGPSGTPINIAEFETIKKSLDSIKSKISNLD